LFGRPRLGGVQKRFSGSIFDFKHESFVKIVSQQVLVRSRLEKRDIFEVVWTVRESSVPYERFLRGENEL